LPISPPPPSKQDNQLFFKTSGVLATHPLAKQNVQARSASFVEQRYNHKCFELINPAATYLLFIYDSDNLAPTIASTYNCKLVYRTVPSFSRKIQIHEEEKRKSDHDKSNKIYYRVMYTFVQKARPSVTTKNICDKRYSLPTRSTITLGPD
jgi:hypothetical protein